MPPTEPRPEPPVLEGALDIDLALSGLRAADAPRTLAAHLLDGGSVAESFPAALLDAADDTDLAGRASRLLAGEEDA